MRRVIISERMRMRGYRVSGSPIADQSGKGGASVSVANSTFKNVLLPRRTRFHFSIIGEEWGFIGTLIVAGLFSVILYQGIKMALHA